MRKFIPIYYLLALAAVSSCVSSLKTNKSNSDDDVYSEDLTAYLPRDTEDSVIVLAEIDETFGIDSTLIITARLDSALQLVNNYNSERTRYIEGLTIQLYSGNDRAKAKEVQMRVYRHFPDSKPKVIFDQPNYKVRMEEFYSQLEAYPVFKSVQAKFGKAILVPTRIPVSRK